jgi:hypothetical protein
MRQQTESMIRQSGTALPKNIMRLKIHRAGSIQSELILLWAEPPPQLARAAFSRP